MALRAIQPESVQKRLKTLFYGNPGVGKTTAAASFPKAYFIDTEKGAENEQYTKLLIDNGSSVFQTNDFDELIKEIMALLTEKHDYKTLVLDSLTTINNDLIDKMALKMGTDFGRHFSEANKKMKHLCNLLLRLDMNVILTAHSKNEYGQNLTVLGTTYDGYKKIDYLFDLVFEIQKRGSDRIGITRKTRLTGFPDGESFVFSYDEIANRYGREILDRDAKPIELASQEQIEQLKGLISIHKISDEISQKWLDRANCESFAEMPCESIQKCIDFLLSKSTGA